MISQTNDKVWLGEYITKPRAVMEKVFLEMWSVTEDEINGKLIQENFRQQQTLNNFFELIQVVMRKVRTHASDDIYFISDYFVTTDGNLEENRINKGKCMAKILYLYVTRQAIQSVYNYGPLRYAINGKYSNLFSDLPIPSDDTVELAKQLESKFNDFTLVDFSLFLTHISKYKDPIMREFNSISCKLSDVNPTIKFEMLQKGLGCKYDCPCCGRPCDVDHSQSAMPIGKDNNRHRCDKGHQYRAFQGFYYETDSEKPEDKREPSLIMCELVEASQTIRHKETGFEGPWYDFKKRFPEWYFGDEATDRKTVNSDQARIRYDTIWRLIGPDICARPENKWKFVTVNSKPKSNSIDTTPKHFYFVVDGSGSMGGISENSRWGSLKKSVLRFVHLRQQCLQDRITIISFADYASITCEDKPIKDVKDLTRIDGGTSFSNAITTLNNALNAKRNNGSSLNNVVAFMSDGEDSYPATELKRLKRDHGSTIKQWFTIAACSNSQILSRINETMNGQLIDVTRDIDIETGLMNAYTEIATLK